MRFEFSAVAGDLAVGELAGLEKSELVKYCLVPMMTGAIVYLLPVHDDRTRAIVWRIEHVLGGRDGRRRKPPMTVANEAVIVLKGVATAWLRQKTCLMTVVMI